LPGKETRLPIPRALLSVAAVLLFLLSPITISPVHSAGDNWSTKSPLDSPRSGLGAAALDGRIYVVGGTDISLQALSATDVYNPATNSWSSATPLPRATSAPGVVALDGRLYSIGGVVPVGLQSSVLTGAVEVYDPTNNSWTSRTPLPRPTQGLLVATVGGLIYALGGLSAGGNENSTWIYNPQNDTWRQGAEMPAYQSSLAQTPDQVAVVDGKIYVFDQSWGSIGPGVPINPSPMFNIVYDPATDSWAHWPALLTRGARGNPISLSLDSMVAIGKKVLVIGGNDLGLWCTGSCSIHPEPSPVNQYNFEYDTLTGNWTRRTDMPTGREGLVTAYLGGMVYAIGGAADKTNPLATGYTDLNEAYTPCSGTCPPFQPSSPFSYLSYAWDGVAAAAIVVVGLFGFRLWRKHQNRIPVRPLDPVNWRS
jgi:N-acetylneuraminic acid mutarotase